MVSRCARRRRWEVGVRARVLGSNPHPHANPHQDGEHLGRKLLTHMRSSTDAPPYLLVLEAIASCSFLVKLAVAEVREGAPKAAPEQGQSAPLAAPQLGSCASPGRAWRLWAARHSQGRGRPTGRPATASAARAHRLQSRPFHRLRHSRRQRTWRRSRRGYGGSR